MRELGCDTDSLIWFSLSLAPCSGGNCSSDGASRVQALASHLISQPHLEGGGVLKSCDGQVQERVSHPLVLWRVRCCLYLACFRPSASYLALHVSVFPRSAAAEREPLNQSHYRAGRRPSIVITSR